MRLKQMNSSSSGFLARNSHVTYDYDGNIVPVKAFNCDKQRLQQGMNTIQVRAPDKIVHAQPSEVY